MQLDYNIYVLEAPTYILWKKYGKAYFNKITINNPVKLTFSSKTVSYLYECKEDLYFNILDGMGYILISSGPSNAYDVLTIKTSYLIKKGTWFNFVSVTDSFSIEASQRFDKYPVFNLNKNYIYRSFEPSLKINQIYDITTFRNFDINEEEYRTQNHWKFYYIVSGEVIIKCNGHSYLLEKGSVFLLKPHQKYILYSNNKKVSYHAALFDMYINDENSSILTNKAFRLHNDIVNSFYNEENMNLADPYVNDFFVLLMERILLGILRGNNKDSWHKGMNEDDLLKAILRYVESEPSATVEMICEKFNYSRTTIQKLFHDKLQTNPNSYFNELKIFKAKELLENYNYSISEISEKCGFTSSQYFSKAFKKYTGMTPSEYEENVHKNS